MSNIDESKFIKDIHSNSGLACVFKFEGKYFGYKENLDRGWVDNINKALLWDTCIPGPEVVCCEDSIVKEQLFRSEKKNVLKVIKYYED